MKTISPRHAAAAVGATIALLGTAIAPAAQTASATTSAPDGLSPATAAASCWEVKVDTPNAPDGVYWLDTPALGAPQQFWCDQTTDGGGWVLIGRGRDNWNQSGEGYGTGADVRTTITGPAAFSARELSAATVGELLNGQPVSSLPDGVRIRRAMNSAGSSWQEVRFTFASPRTDWSWEFDDLQRVKSYRFTSTSGTVTGTGGNTEVFGSDSKYNKVQTQTVNHAATWNTAARYDGWATGFGYGASITAGSTSSTDYLYRASTGYTRPFAQMYLRPKLLSSSIFTAIPDSGTPAVTQAPLLSSRALKTVEGVNGLGKNGTGIENTEVSAFTESNGEVYVGGNFDHVQQNAAGAGLVHQSYLAAFDVKTGQLVPGFAPRFDQQVKALATLPDGRIVAGGDFQTVNGVPENGLVVLDPTTGAIDKTFTGRLLNALSASGGQAIVRALDVQGGWVYVGGSFTHATGGSTTAKVYSRSAVRMSVTDGTPDATWTAAFDGTVVSLDASAQGDRVYFAGYFANDKTTHTVRGAAIRTTDGSVIPWTLRFTDPANYQQAVREVGGRVWIGGSQHEIMSYNRADLSLASTNVMSMEGGDGQVIGSDGTTVFGGCHCWLGVYENTTTTDFHNPGTSWTRASKIEALGAWNAATGAYQPGFSPSFTSREGAGAWAAFTDSTGVTWVGGDFTAARMGTGAKSWVGGYARFAPNDATAPTAPTGLKVASTASGVSAAWNASTDASGDVTYEVLRNDRVIATTTSTSVVLPAAPASAKYFVRAADPSGNRSPSTPAAQVAVAVAGQPLPSGTVVLDSGSTWSYWSQATAPAADWQTPAFDASAWPTGTAVLGWGTTGITTQLPALATGGHPLGTSFRGSFRIAAGEVPTTGLTLTTRADDGIVVSVNGTEVGRANLPAGTITASTDALSAPSTATATANPVTFQVPASLLVAGTNVITAQVQSNYRSTPNVSFDLNAVVQ